jgi:RHS repeat-associated protein
MIEKRVSNRNQNNMGEITKSTRAYALPTQAQPIALSTEFTYDSWGRMLQIVYPDGEILNYGYDRGGQLKSMQGVKDSCTYNYLIDQKYDKFGAKTEMAYGNYMVTKYMYNPLNLRLDSLVASLQSNNYFSMGYRYDAKGNVTQLHSKYSCFNGNNPITQTFVYDSTDQLTDAQGTFYTTTVTYGNTGKIATYSSPTTPNTTFYYPDIKPTSTVFAPDSSFDGDRFTYYDFGINGSLRRKWHYEGDEFNREERGEYYWFNAFNCMKAYSFNGERYGYYGYDASGERTYKINVNPDILYINAENVSMTYHIDRYMLYPNGYMNVNQAGEYTKHYYADALRIASKIGGNYDNNFCDSVAQIETDYPEYITHRKNEQEFAMKNELDSVTKYNIITSTLLFDAPNECLLHGGFEEEVFYYHPDHLGSTGMVTNKYANITQALLYAPFGEIVNEYNPGWSSNRVPKYSFNAKELDEENNMYYYSARYYAPPTFISRDPLFEKYPSISPYAYCNNNPIRFIDPTGMFYEDPPKFPMTEAYIKGLWNGFKGGLDLIIHPKETFNNLKQAVANPKETLQAIGNSISDSYEAVRSGDGEKIASITGNILGGFVFAEGTAKVVSGISKATSATSAVGELSTTGIKVGSDVTQGVSPNVQKVLNTLDDIKVQGGTVKVNPLNPTQEINMTFQKGTQKLDLRIETHTIPKKYGGNGVTPQRHMNVDLYPNKKVLPNSGHKILE